MVCIGNDWDELIGDVFATEGYGRLREFLISEYRSRRVYPDMYHIFEALKQTSFADTKAVILGQDPYHGSGQAHGLCFSVQKGIPKPPSLKNIFAELSTDLGISAPAHGELTCWAQQGVLLLNAVLTVREGQAASHRGMGWETVTDRVVKELNKKQTPVVFLLWGASARAKAAGITNPLHTKLTAPHPSPLSCYQGFLGCRHFSRANEFLIESGQEPIDWEVR